MKKITKRQSLYLLLVVVAIGLGLTFLNWNSDDIEYPYVTSIAGSVPGDSMAGIINHPPELIPEQLTHEFHYNIGTNPRHFYIDHPFYGIKCSLFTYTTELEGNVLIINESQEGNCTEKDTFYVTTSLTESRDFDTIRLNEIINGETLVTNEFKIDPTIITR